MWDFLFIFFIIFLVMFLPLDLSILSYYLCFFWLLSFVLDLFSTRIDVERNAVFLFLYKKTGSFIFTAVIHAFLVEIPTLLIITLILSPLTASAFQKALLMLAIAHTDATIKNLNS